MADEGANWENSPQKRAHWEDEGAIFTKSENLFRKIPLGSKQVYERSQGNAFISIRVAFQASDLDWNTAKKQCPGFICNIHWYAPGNSILESLKPEAPSSCTV